MFIINKTQETSIRYSRLIGKRVANIAFISFENPMFIHSFKRDDEHYSYKYIADFEFLDYLGTLLNQKIPHNANVLICIDSLPDELRTFLRINPDVVSAFKTICEDLHLDRLVKEI